MNFVTYLLLCISIGTLKALVVVKPDIQSKVPESQKLQIQIIRTPRSVQNVQPVTITKVPANNQAIPRVTTLNRTLPVEMTNDNTNTPYVQPYHNGFTSVFKESGNINHYSNVEINKIPINSYDPLLLGNPDNKIKIDTQTQGDFNIVTKTNAHFGDQAYGNNPNNNQIQQGMTLDSIKNQLSESLNHSQEGQPIVVDPNVAHFILEYLKQSNANSQPDIANQQDVEIQNLEKRIQELQLEIENLNKEIERLNYEGKSQEAAVLQLQEQKLEVEELGLEIKEQQKQDQDLRANIETVINKEDEIIKNGGDDIALANLQTQLGDLVVQDANTDNTIKNLEIQQIEVERNELNGLKEIAENKNAEPGQINTINETIAQLDAKENAIQSDQQIQQELNQEIQLVDERINVISNEQGHANELISLLKMKRKLQDTENEILSGTYISAAEGYKTADTTEETTVNSNAASSSDTAQYNYATAEETQDLIDQIDKSLNPENYYAYSDNNLYDAAGNPVASIYSNLPNAKQALNYVTNYYQNVLSIISNINENDERFNYSTTSEILPLYDLMIQICNNYDNRDVNEDKTVEDNATFLINYTHGITSEQDAILQYFGLLESYKNLCQQGNASDADFVSANEVLIENINSFISENQEIKERSNILYNSHTNVSFYINEIKAKAAENTGDNEQMKADITSRYLPSLITTRNDIESSSGYITEGFEDFDRVYNDLKTNLTELECAIKKNCNQSASIETYRFKRVLY